MLLIGKKKKKKAVAANKSVNAGTFNDCITVLQKAPQFKKNNIHTNRNMAWQKKKKKETLLDGSLNITHAAFKTPDSDSKGQSFQRKILKDEISSQLDPLQTFFGHEIR